MATALILEGDLRRLCARLHDEQGNPPALRQNLDLIVDRAILHLQDQGIGTTYQSAVTCLMYMARDGKVDDDLRQALYDAIKEYS